MKHPPTLAFVPLPLPAGAARLSRVPPVFLWLAVGIAAIVLFVVFPIGNLVVAPGSALHISDYWVTLIGKIMCYAIVALAMDLIWGYTGILSLGHGLFFALGGYAMGMHLMRSIGRAGVYHSDLPAFMVLLDCTADAWYWSVTEHVGYAAA